MRVAGHIGNGTVFLLSEPETTWINVDLVESGSALASDCPGGVKKWGTTETNYYGKLNHINQLVLGKSPPDHETTVTDRYGSFSNMPFDDNSLDHLLCRQAFEHLSKTEAKRAAEEMRRVLKVGGTLRIDVPDHEESLAFFARSKATAERLDSQGKYEEALKMHNHAAFMLRHLLGSRKNDFAYHLGSWTRDRLIRFFASYGFDFWDEEDNQHFYPAISLRFCKRDTCDFPELDEQIIPWKAAYEYCGDPLGTPLTVPADWKVLEVGPGRNRLPFACAYVDIDDSNLSRIRDEFLAKPGVPWPDFANTSVEQLPKEWTGRFDHCFLSHIMEHADDPLKAAAEINRVAKSGCIVSPSPFKEGMFLAHELDHKWWVFSGADCLYFKRIPDGLYARAYRPNLSGELHRIWRYGERRIETICNEAKRHFHDTEPWLDTIFKWGPHPLKVVVLE